MYNISENDTICAVSTPGGVGGIAVIRVSGPQALEISDRIWKGKALSGVKSHTAHLGEIVESGTDDEPLDQCVATVFKAPNSFTGEDVVEFSVHGSRWIQRELVNLLIRSGCRLAEPGEFTRRAFASGKLDLAQAEAVADVIASSSKSAHRLASSQMRGVFSKNISALRDNLIKVASLLELELDFSEEEVEFASRDELRSMSQDLLERIERLARTFSTGNAIKEGVPVAIVGEPNVGKSTLLNLLLNDNRAIVSDIPGTTRDTIEDTVDIDGVMYRFIDTAGIRETADTVENMGIRRTMAAVSKARIVVWLVTPDILPGHFKALAGDILKYLPEEAKVIIAVNKMDKFTDASNPFYGKWLALEDLMQNLPGETSKTACDSRDKNSDISSRKRAEQDSETYEESTCASSTEGLGQDSEICEESTCASSMECLEQGSEAYEERSCISSGERTERGSEAYEKSSCIFSREHTERGSDEHFALAEMLLKELPEESRLLFISAARERNIDALRALLRELSGADDTSEADMVVTNARHYEALIHAKESLTRVLEGIDSGLSGDFIAQDLRETIHHLGTITGTITTTDLLKSIFENFCIGK